MGNFVSHVPSPHPKASLLSFPPMLYYTLITTRIYPLYDLIWETLFPTTWTIVTVCCCMFNHKVDIPCQAIPSLFIELFIKPHLLCHLYHLNRLSLLFPMMPISLFLPLKVSLPSASLMYHWHHSIRLVLLFQEVPKSHFFYQGLESGSTFHSSYP